MSRFISFFNFIRKNKLFGKDDTRLEDFARTILVNYDPK